MQNEPDDFQSLEGKKIYRRLSVDYISFAAHVDYSQNSKFIDDVKPAHLVRVLFGLQCVHF
jgi:cleavage and polyadenylation specificity factor subunit 3